MSNSYSAMFCVMSVMTIALISGLPMIDLPLPLMVLGGVMLAIASNREQHLTNLAPPQSPASIDEASKTAYAKDESELPEALHSNARPNAAQSNHPSQKRAARQSAASNPASGGLVEPNGASLPVFEGRKRPISPVINRDIPIPQSQTESKRATDRTPAGRSPNVATDPQLPMIGSKNPPRKDVSFRIQNPEEES